MMALEAAAAVVVEMMNTVGNLSGILLGAWDMHTHQLTLKCKTHPGLP
jgi:hypothetical protein